MVIQWLKAHVRENNRQEAPTREQLQKLDCLKDLDIFETMGKILNIPMEVKKIWARRRLLQVRCEQRRRVEDSLPEGK